MQSQRTRDVPTRSRARGSAARCAQALCRHAPRAAAAPAAASQAARTPHWRQAWGSQATTAARRDSCAASCAARRARRSAARSRTQPAWAPRDGRCTCGAAVRRWRRQRRVARARPVPARATDPPGARPQCGRAGGAESRTGLPLAHALHGRGADARTGRQLQARDSLTRRQFASRRILRPLQRKAHQGVHFAPAAPRGDAQRAAQLSHIQVVVVTSTELRDVGVHRRRLPRHRRPASAATGAEALWLEAGHARRACEGNDESATCGADAKPFASAYHTGRSARRAARQAAAAAGGRARRRPERRPGGRAR